MVNTRILKQAFEYFEPRTIQESLRLLDQYGGDAKVIAGGSDLLVQMKHETVNPKYLINISKIPDLNYIKDNESLHIRAATTLHDVLRFCARDRRYAALFEAIKSLGTVQIRNVGTIGGNICNASPAADSAPPLLVFDAQVKLCSLRSEKLLLLTDFFKGANLTVMASNEILTEIEIPPVPKGSGNAFLKITRAGADISKLSVAVALERDGEICTSCRIALGAVAPVPMRVKQAEKLLIGKKIEHGLLEEVGKKAAEEIKPVSDIRSTAEYRKKTAAFLVKEVLLRAWQRATAEEL